VFAVYAPNELTATECIKKIDDDFSGALPHWRAYYDRWVFVHNDRNGFSPDVFKRLEELNSNWVRLSLDDETPNDQARFRA